jgi:hypothetical protein|tara:strand:+ start:979 stop:1209 length:231 start_codon:yes stop_codon:yes gene_type:complete
MNYTTNTDRRLQAQAKTLENRLCETLENYGAKDKKINLLILEANMLHKYGALNKSEHKQLTNLEMYCEILDIKYKK